MMKKKEIFCGFSKLTGFQFAIPKGKSYLFLGSHHVKAGTGRVAVVCSDNYL